MRIIHLLFVTAITSGINAQVPNAGFESITTVGETVFPADWSGPTEFGYGAVEDAHSGTYSLGVWNWYFYAEGYAMNGANTWPMVGGTPITQQPTALTGWYKRLAGDLQEGEGNAAHITALLTRWNAATGARDTVAMGLRLFNEQPSWTAFSIDIVSFSSETADTLAILIGSCENCICAETNDGTCAYLLVDDLLLVNPTGLTEPVLTGPMASLVSLGDGHMIVRCEQVGVRPTRLRLSDASGRCLADVPVTQDGQRIQLHQTGGIVAYTFSANDGSTSTGRVVLP